MPAAREPAESQQVECVGKENHFRARRKPLQRHTQQAKSFHMKLDIISLEETINKFGQVRPRISLSSVTYKNRP